MINTRDCIRLRRNSSHKLRTIRERTGIDKRILYRISSISRQYIGRPRVLIRSIQQITYAICQITNKEITCRIWI